MTDNILIALVILTVAAVIIATQWNSKHTYHTPQPDHWKTIVYIQYKPKDKIFMLQHKDYSFIEYYNDNNIWRKLPSMRRVDDSTQYLINDLFHVKLKGRGGSKTLS